MSVIPILGCISGFTCNGVTSISNESMISFLGRISCLGGSNSSLALSSSSLSSELSLSSSACFHVISTGILHHCRSISIHVR
jgi:hypothetical protein